MVNGPHFLWPVLRYTCHWENGVMCPIYSFSIFQPLPGSELRAHNGQFSGEHLFLLLLCCTSSVKCLMYGSIQCLKYKRTCCTSWAALVPKCCGLPLGNVVRLIALHSSPLQKSDMSTADTFQTEQLIPKQSRSIFCKAAKRSNSLCIFGMNYHRHAGSYLYKGRISPCVWTEPTSPPWQHVSRSSEPARGPGSAAAACPWPHDAASSAAPARALLLVAPSLYCTAWTQTGRKTSLDTCRLTCQHREAVSNIYSYFSSNTLRSCSLFSRQLCLSFSSASREVAWAFRASHSLAS